MTFFFAFQFLGGGGPGHAPGYLAQYTCLVYSYLGKYMFKLPLKLYHHECSHFARSMQNKLNDIKFAICHSRLYHRYALHAICHLWKVVTFWCLVVKAVFSGVSRILFRGGGGFKIFL